MKMRVRLTRSARNDIKRILRRSELEFGIDRRVRYKALLDQGIADLAVDPGRIGAQPIDGVRPGYFIYHLKRSKPRVSGPSVKQPRHLPVFSITDDGSIILASVVHERELLERHFTSQ